MRPKTTAMQRTMDMEGGGGGGFGKSKAPLPPATKHCTTITVTANGQRSPDSPSLSQVSNRRSVEMTDGQRPLRTPSVKSSQAPPPPTPASPSTPYSPTHALPRGSPAATVNGHSRRGGSDGSSSISSLSGGSGSVHAETDFYSSLPDLLPEEVILPPSSSSSFQHSLPPSPATSGYCSPLPSPETGSSAGRRSLGRQQQQYDGQDTLSNSSFSNNEAEEDNVTPILLPPPAQFGNDEGVDDNVDDAQDDDDDRHYHHNQGGQSLRTRQSPPPSPPLDYVQPETRGGLRSSKPRPFSETEVAHRHRTEAPASATLAYPFLVSSSASPSSSKSSALTRTVSCPVPDALPKEVFHMHVRTTTTLDTLPENHAEVVMDSQQAFAGRRDVRDLQHLQEKEICSLRGSVRGFKNRVRAGISTFIDTRSNKFNYLELEKGKIVVYTTSMTVVRETYDRCKVARNILQTHMVRYEERDLYMSHEHQRQLSERMDMDHVHSKAVRLPQIFINGIHIGGATELEKLNETGELRQILDSFPKIQVRTMCSNCGGYRYVPCMVCHGSKKSVHRNNFTEEFCALRCMHCNENGLQRCQSCLDQQE